MLCYILAQYAPQVHENILLFFDIKNNPTAIVVGFLISTW